MNKLSSVFYMWVGLAFGVLATLMMFVPIARLDGTTLPAIQLFWSVGTSGGAWPSFVGYMLILAGALATGVMALPIIQPSSKTEKIVLISSLVAIVVGAILVALIYVLYSSNNGYYRFLNEFHTGYYLTLAFAAIAATMDVIALVLDW